MSLVSDAETGRESSVRMYSVKDHHIREYACRDWAKVGYSDREHWVRRFRAKGPSATVEASHAVFEHARSARGDFPGVRFATADLTSLQQQLDHITVGGNSSIHAETDTLSNDALWQVGGQ